MSAKVEATEPDALTYWQGMLAKATNSFERNRAAGMIRMFERQQARARGEVVEIPVRRNYGYGHWSRRAR